MAKVLLKTNKGDITLTLDSEKAPKSVANFLQYVKSGHYDGTIFHRVINNFMIQGGGMTAGMKQKPKVMKLKMRLTMASRMILALLPWHALATHTQQQPNSLSTLMTMIS
jgi:cyclophilin family peptidyl-prolyl cis-trans isomerase